MRWFILPVSIGAHLVAAVVLLVVPLAAEVERPVPAPLHSVLLTTVVPVPPDLVAVVPPRRVASPVPAVAPWSLAPERTPAAASPSSTDPAAFPTQSRSIELGPPAGIGSAIAVSAPAPAESAQAAPRVPLRVGQGVREPRKILDVVPIYPPLALSARVQGPVILEAVINERGVVERVKVLGSIALLDAAAVDAVSRWRYTPTLLNGTPVAVLMTITINFRLNQ
jgi:protein TonB